MNRKGILFTFMVFMLVMLALSLSATIREKRIESEAGITRISGIIGVSNKFQNIINDVVALDKNGTAMEVQERVLPFSYSIDGNRMAVGLEVPLKEATIRNYFDIINAYAIFISDSNAQTTYDLMVVDANAAGNKYWDGNTSSLQFMVLPQCLKFVVFDENRAGFAAGAINEGCDAGFSTGALVRYDLNIAIKQATQDYNRIVCNFSGGGCPDEGFDAGSGEPYFEMIVDDTNCSSCNLGAEAKHIRGHYDPAFSNTVTISCQGSACITTEEIEITVNEGISAGNTGGAADASMGVELNGRVGSFRFMDFNLSVRQDDFNALMKNA